MVLLVLAVRPVRFCQGRPVNIHCLATICLFSSSFNLVYRWLTSSKKSKAQLPSTNRTNHGFSCVKYCLRVLSSVSWPLVDFNRIDSCKISCKLFRVCGFSRSAPWCGPSVRNPVDDWCDSVP